MFTHFLMKDWLYEIIYYIALERANKMKKKHNLQGYVELWAFKSIRVYN